MRRERGTTVTQKKSHGRNIKVKNGGTSKSCEPGIPKRGEKVK